MADKPKYDTPGRRLDAKRRRIARNGKYWEIYAHYLLHPEESLDVIAGRFKCARMTVSNAISYCLSRRKLNVKR